MDEIIKEAAKCYKIELQGWTRSKAAFLLDTNEGALFLKRHETCLKTEQMYNITEQLRLAGFNSAERYLTADGKPYTFIKGGVYTLSDCGTGSKCGLNDIENIAAIAKTLARMHDASVNTSFSADVLKTSEPDHYAKRIAEARHIKKWLDSQSRMTDIDVLFVKKYGEYLKKAFCSAEQICGYIKNADLCLCFVEIKEDNVLLDSRKNVTLVNFENCALSSPNTDLCQLIRRFLKRGGNNESVPKIIEAYQEERELSLEDIKFIKAYLSFPHKFFALTNKYYNSRRVFDNSHTLAKLTNEIAYQNKVSEILNAI